MAEYIAEVNHVKKIYRLNVKEPGIRGAFRNLAHSEWTEKTALDDVSFRMDEGQALDTFRSGNILVIHQVTKSLLPLLRKAAGLILEDSDPDGTGAIAGLSLDIPVIIGASGATRILKSGAVVTMDGLKGTVSCN